MSTVVFGVSTAVLSDRFFRFLARPPNGHGRPRFLPGHGKDGSDGGRWRQGFSLHTIASGRTLPTHTTQHGTHVPTTHTLHVSYRLPNTPFMAHASPANLPVTTTATHNLSLTSQRMIDTGLAPAQPKCPTRRVFDGSLHGMTDSSADCASGYRPSTPRTRHPRRGELLTSLPPTSRGPPTRRKTWCMGSSSCATMEARTHA